MKVHARTLAAAPLTGLLLATMLFTPFAASAATKKPSCTLDVTTSTGETEVKSNKKEGVTVSSGESFTIHWSSENADTAEMNDGDVALSGSSTTTPTEDQDYRFTFRNGSKKVRCTVEVSVVEPASIDTDALKTDSPKPSLTGSAGGYEKLYVAISEKGSNDTLLLKKATVHHGTWKYRVTKKLADGAYDVRLTDKDGEATYASGTLVIGEVTSTSDSKLSLSFLPLLAGGTAHAYGNIPVMYLVVRNTGTEAAHVTGITLREDGSAPASLITSLATSDDKGGSRATSAANPFGNGATATSPTDASIPAGGVKIFTVKAQLGATAAYSGTQLMLNVVGIDTDGDVLTGFPVHGATWVIAQ